MSFLLSHHWFLILFFAVPVILHLLKKQRAKRVIISSLSLLQSKKRELRKNLKLHQLLLLLSRVCMALCLAIFFLQPLLHTSSSLIRSVFPFHDRVKIYLDTNWDKRSELLETLFNEIPGLEDIEMEIVAMEGKQSAQSLANPVLELLESGTIVEEKTYLVSRFYGLQPQQLRELESRGFHPVLHGPRRIENTGLFQVQARPSDPFPGEAVELTGVVATNSQSKKKQKVMIQWEDQDIELEVEPDSKNPAGFYYERSLSLSQSNEIMVRISEDGFDRDNEVTLSLNPKNKMRIALVTDRKDWDSRSHQLFFIREFLEAYFGSFLELDFNLETMNGKSSTLKDGEGWDLVVLGPLNHPVWTPKAGLVLLLPQELQAVRSFYDEKLAMRSFDLVSQERRLQVENISLEDKSLLDRPWSVYRYQQMQIQDAQDLIMSSKEQMLVRKENFLISAFHFHDLDFSGVYHPLFPVYLYRLFTNRKSESANQAGLQASLFERDEGLQIGTNKEGREVGLADLSKLLLFFFFLFLLIEVILIRQIEQMLQSKKSESPFPF